ncbi:Alpha/beta hydrolase fold-1 [Artemisia annua]|uniref:Alpha/beta hydrolase fold-1 n=1 Tax=Artemisia annua TaxID=35608 RepID=A0A2U1KBD8_ARTAN|nr:Alpha/beta hydrolase fold-1 [Artemisia annua]
MSRRCKRGKAKGKKIYPPESFYIDFNEDGLAIGPTRSRFASWFSLELKSRISYHLEWDKKPGDIEAELTKLGTQTAIKKFFTFREPEPFYFPKGIGFKHSPGETPVALPPWLAEEDIDYFATQLEKTGWSGGINYYRALHLYG